MPRDKPMCKLCAHFERAKAKQATEAQRGGLWRWGFWVPAQSLCFVRSQSPNPQHACRTKILANPGIGLISLSGEVYGPRLSATEDKMLNAHFEGHRSALWLLTLLFTIVSCVGSENQGTTDNGVGFQDTPGPTPNDMATQDSGLSNDGTLEDFMSPMDPGSPMIDTGNNADAGEIIEPPAPINKGWIGGPCTADSECSFEGGYCLLEDEGFPNGMCSQNCDLYCPDQDGMVTTFCIPPEEVELFGETGLCTVRCDFGVSDTGCREGYKCVPTPRFGDPGTVINSCIPGESTPAALTPCYQELIDRGVSFTPAESPDASPDGFPELICHIEDPVWVSPVLHGVTFRYATDDAEAKPIFAGCELALAMEETAAILAEQGVTDLIHLGVYNCRVISGTSSLSEHGRANAIDIKGVKQANGEVVTLQDHWEMNTDFPVTDEGALLKWLAETMYDEWIYNIILTPDYNAAHWNHFHCDLTPGSHYIK